MLTSDRLLRKLQTERFANGNRPAIMQRLTQELFCTLGREDKAAGLPVVCAGKTYLEGYEDGGL